MNNVRPIVSRINDDKRWFTVSNLLTFSRVLLSPFMVAAICFQWWRVAFGVLIFASGTDLLDGYLARLLDEQTSLGALLDPIADKIFLVSCFSALAFLHSPSFYIPTWFVVLVISRELIILLGTYVLLRKQAHVVVQPTMWGKLTTFSQLIFIAWLFVCYFFKWTPAKTYNTLLVMLALFSCISLLQYIKIGLSYLGNRVYKR